MRGSKSLPSFLARELIILSLGVVFRVSDCREDTEEIGEEKRRVIREYEFRLERWAYQMYTHTVCSTGYADC